MTKLEEIARAMWNADSQRAAGRGRLVAWEDEGDHVRAKWLGLALAAVKAMREPDNAMLHAMAKAMSPGRRPTPERVSVKQKHKTRFTAAIDSIIAEAEQEGE